MGFLKLIKRSLKTVHHLDLFCRQSKRPLYNLAKVLAPPPPPPPLEPITKNKFIVKNNFEFSKKISGIGNPLWPVLSPY